MEMRLQITSEINKADKQTVENALYTFNLKPETLNITI